MPTLPPLGHMLSGLPLGGYSPVLATILSGVIGLYLSHLAMMGKGVLIGTCERRVPEWMSDAKKFCFILDLLQLLVLNVILMNKAGDAFGAKVRMRAVETEGGDGMHRCG